MSRFKISRGVLVLVSIILVFAMSLQMFSPQTGNATTKDRNVSFVKEDSSITELTPRADSPESRYGFTVNLSWTSSDSFTVRDVATGDIDGDGDNDIVSCGDTNCKVYKNDGTGTSFSSGWSAPGLTGIATNVKVYNADGDSDLDIILLTQSEIPEFDGVYSTGSIVVYVFLNDGSGSFTLGDSHTFTAGFVNYHEYYWTGYSHLACGDINGDNNVDIAVSVFSGASNQNTTTYHILSFNGVDTLTDDASRAIKASAADGWLWGYVGFGDFDGVGGDDLVTTISGFESAGSGPLKPASASVWLNSGTSPAATGTIVGTWNYIGANYGNYVYSMIVGDASDDGKDDIIVGTNYDLGGAYADGMIWVCKGLGSGSVKSPEMWYQTAGHWQPRDLKIGNFDVETGTDIIPNYWFENSNPPVNFVIDTYSFEFGSGRQSSPVPKFLKKWEGKTGFALPSGQLLCVDGADFDKASPTVEDVVAGGSNTWVFTVCYPPNNLPKMVNSSWSKNPILNDGVQQTTLNVSIKDLDGSDRDLGESSVVIDLSGIGGTVDTPMTDMGYDGANNLRFYHKTFTVADTTSPGLVKLQLTITDKCTESYPGPAPGISKDNVTLTVQQFNRPPQVSENAIFEMVLDEDQAPYTIPDLSDFFEDPDGDPMTFDLGSAISNEYNSAILKVIYYDTDHSTKVSVLKNAFGTDQIPVRAHDGMYTTVHKINVTVNSINDAPVIFNTGSEDWTNNSFKLTQDLRFKKTILAEDVEGDTIHFSIDFEGTTKKMFDIDELTGEIDFTPSNLDVGVHEAVISADDQNGGVTAKTFWFNVTNKNDPPIFIKIGEHKITANTTDILFNVTEHEWINFSVEALDPDVDIKAQSSVFFSSDLSKMNESFFVIEDEKDPMKADIAFWAHGSGITCTVPQKGFGPLKGKLTVTDSMDHTLKSTVNISFGIENVNDPPSPAKIASPEDNETFMTMEVEFVAGIVTDPDEIYGDEITYIWDFNDEDGINDEDAYGLQPTWEYENNGDYFVTLWVKDKENLTSKYAQVLVHVRGDPSGTDADGDGLPDEWEDKWGLNPYNAEGDHGWDGDPDGDGVPNYKEMERFTNPLDKDTDKDGHWDGDDAYPNDAERWKDEPDDKSFLASYWWIFLVILAIILLLIVIIVIVVVVMMGKKKQEEEEARAIAAAAAKEDPYATQELYGDLGQAQQQIAQAQPDQGPQGPPGEPVEALDFDRPEGIEPLEPSGPGPESPDSALPPGGPEQDMDGPPGQQVQLPPQGGAPDLQPPPALPPGNPEQ